MRRSQVGEIVLQPFYAARGWLLDRYYSREPPHHTVLERGARSAIEAVMDVVQCWEMAPDFKRLEKLARENEERAAYLKEVRQKYGLDTPQAPPPKEK